MTKLSIVIPCYNEGATLSQLVEGYALALKDLPDVELILVDNGSTDDTAAKLRIEQNKKIPFPLKIVTVPVNIGYGHGMLTGLAQASGEFLAWSHADLQCPPQDVVRLYQAVMEQTNPKRCFGKGFRTNDRGGAAIFTKIQTGLTNLVLGTRMEEINAQPKLFHRDFLQSFKAPPKGFELDIYSLYKAVQMNLDIVTIGVCFHERKAGQSKWAYSLYSRLRFIVNSLIYLMKLKLRAGKI